MIEIGILKNLKDRLVMSCERFYEFSDKLIMYVEGTEDFSKFKESHKAEVDVDISCIIEQLNAELASFDVLLKEWNDYNDQYRQYCIDRFKNIIEIVDKVCIHNVAPFIGNTALFQNLLILSGYVKRDQKYELFQNFKNGDKNYVLFGKNGAGKTSLLKKLSADLLNTNTIVVPATRYIDYEPENCWFCDNDVNLNSALASKDKSMFLLSKCILASHVKSGFEGEESILKAATDIFSKLGIERQLEINEFGNLFLRQGDNDAYSFEHASDGEKSTVYLMFAVLLAPANAYIFIDEPESHLNGALMRKLLDILQKKRRDIKYIFATHNIAFIERCKDVDLIYLEKIKKVNEWVFRPFKHFNDLPLDIILNIEGTNDNVIFCEGEDDSSYDCKLYSILYPEYQLMAAHGCDNVIVHTDIINEHSKTFKKKAYGIVDNDFRSDDNIKRLNSKKITVLPVNEVENLFMSSCCLKLVKEHMNIDSTLDDTKTYIISKIMAKKNDIVKDYATKLLRTQQMKNKFSYKKNIIDQLDEIHNENKNVFIKDYNGFIEKLNRAIEGNDYNELMRIVPGKMMIDYVAKVMGLNDANKYKKLVLNLLDQNDEAVQELKNMIGLITD